MQTTIYFFLFVVTSCLAQSDLNAPAVKSQTLGSEIKRGCSVLSTLPVGANASQTQTHIEAILQSNPASNTNGFVLGVHLKAWMHFAGLARVQDQQGSGFDHEIVLRSAALYWIRLTNDLKETPLTWEQLAEPTGHTTPDYLIQLVRYWEPIQARLQ